MDDPPEVAGAGSISAFQTALDRHANGVAMRESSGKLRVLHGVGSSGWSKKPFRCAYVGSRSWAGAWASLQLGGEPVGSTHATFPLLAALWPHEAADPRS